MGRARDRASADLNGQEFILDADADTSISADTDDQIDIKIAGADDFQFTANTFTVKSGSTIVVDDTTDSTSTTTGSIQTDGGVGIAKDLVVGDDLFLKSDSAVLNFGADNDITVTHVADSGLIVKSGSSGQTAGTFADELVIEHGSYNGGMTILTGGTANARICFGDDDDNDVGQFNYDHSKDELAIITGGQERVRFGNGENGGTAAEINVLEFQHQINMADDASFQFNLGSGIVYLASAGNREGALFHTYANGQPTRISDPNGFCESSDSDGDLCLFKSSGQTGTNIYNVKNRTGATIGVNVICFTQENP